jgi:virulence-associated protein VapD
MFAIAFDLVVADTERHHPKGVSQAYTDIADALKRFGFRRIQGSVYVTESEDMANLFEAINGIEGVAVVPRFSARHPCVPN